MIDFLKAISLLLSLAVAITATGQERVSIYPAHGSVQCPHRTDKVTLEIYAAENPRAAAVVCPGGSYCWLDYEGEGVEVAKFLQQNGISAFVLRYRVAGWWAWFTHYRVLFRGNIAPDMYNDGQRALQWVVSNAERYGIDTSTVGIIGFSAGGHLAMSQAVYPGEVRPAFAAPIYPVVTMTEDCVHKRSRRGLLGERRTRTAERMEKWSLERNVTKSCPPIFLVNCVDDPVVDYRNSVLLDSALTAAGVEHEYIQYKAGGHGFGVSESKGSVESREWKYRFLEWINRIVKSKTSTPKISNVKP